LVPRLGQDVGHQWIDVVSNGQPAELGALLPSPSFGGRKRRLFTHVSGIVVLNVKVVIFGQSLECIYLVCKPIGVVNVFTEVVLNIILTSLNGHIKDFTYEKHEITNTYV